MPSNEMNFLEKDKYGKGIEIITEKKENNVHNIRRMKSYSCRSQAGCSSGYISKTNQDSFILMPNFFNVNSHFFGVCDGHGMNNFFP